MFKDELCAAMEKENVSVKWLAEYSGVSTHTVCNWRSGRAFPKQKTLNELCDLFKLPKDSYVKEYEEAQKGGYNKPINFIFNGEKLKELRTQRKWTQEQLGNLLNVNDSAVGNWETGHTNPGVISLRAMCSLFGVHEDYFKKRDKTMNEVRKDYGLNKIEPVEKKPDRSLEDIWLELDARLNALGDMIDKWCRDVEALKKHIDEISVFAVERDARISDIESDMFAMGKDISDLKQQVRIKSESNQALSDALKALSSVILKGDRI